MTKQILTSLLGIALLAVAMPAMASEITGTLSTDISTGINGSVVVAPVASPAPSAGPFTSTQTVTLSAPGSRLSTTSLTRPTLVMHSLVLLVQRPIL